jgi:hypothetical protein
MLESAIEYLSKIRPGFPKEIRGATIEKIQLLEGAVGRRLPKSYVEFLSLMGEKTGTLHLTPECAMDIDSITELHRDEITTGQTVVPEDAIVIAAFGIAIPMLCLKPIDADDPAVYASDLTIHGLYAQSLANMICHTAFYTYQLASYPNRITLHVPVKSPPIMEKSKEAVERHNYTAQAFSDTACSCFESENSAVGIKDMAFLGRMVTIGFREENEITPLIESLQKTFPFKILRH